MQADPFPDGHVEYIRIRNPFTRAWDVLEIKCPIYGDDRAAKWFYESALAQLRHQGFHQGYDPSSPSNTLRAEYQRAAPANAPCIFYQPDTDTVVLLYVDDMLIDGREKYINIFLQQWQQRFQTTAPEWLSDDNPIDFIGVIISQAKGAIFLSMAPYIQKLLKQFDMQHCQPAKLPLAHDITDLRPLDTAQQEEFWAKLGSCGWLSQTTAMHTRHAVTRIAMYVAKPCLGALAAVNHLLRYHSDNVHHAIGVPLFDPNPPKGSDMFAMYADSDNGSNPEVNNKRRGHYSNIIGYRSSQEAVDAIGGIVPCIAPIIVTSKNTGIAFATPKIGHSHAGTGSGENEIYSLANLMDAVLRFSYMYEELSGKVFPYPAQVYTDATTANVFANGTAQKTRLQHIDNRQQWVHVCRDSRIATCSHVRGTENPADLGSKGFFKSAKMFTKLVRGLYCKAPTNVFSTPDTSTKSFSHMPTTASSDEGDLQHGSQIS